MKQRTDNLYTIDLELPTVDLTDVVLPSTKVDTTGSDPDALRDIEGDDEDGLSDDLQLPVVGPDVVGAGDVLGHPGGSAGNGLTDIEDDDGQDWDLALPVVDGGGFDGGQDDGERETGSGLAGGTAGEVGGASESLDNSAQIPS